MKLSDNYSEEDIRQQSNKVRALEEEVELAEQRYDVARAQVKINRELSSYTLEELRDLDKANAQQKIKTNYAERYLASVQEINNAEGQRVATSNKFEGIGDQVNTERAAANITNLVSSFTSLAFAMQSVNSI
jgi:phage shock protein A